jgi:hypothetical protein
MRQNRIFALAVVFLVVGCVLDYASTYQCVTYFNHAQFEGETNIATRLTMQTSGYHVAVLQNAAYVAVFCVPSIAGLYALKKINFSSLGISNNGKIVNGLFVFVLVQFIIIGIPRYLAAINNWSLII